MKNNIRTVLNSLSTAQVNGAKQALFDTITAAGSVSPTDEGKKVVPPKVKDLDEIMEEFLISAAERQDASAISAFIKTYKSTVAKWEASDPNKSFFKGKEAVQDWQEQRRSVHQPVLYSAVTEEKPAVVPAPKKKSA